MTGPQILIAAIIIVMIIAFLVTVVLQNISAGKFISANTELHANRCELKAQNKLLAEKLQASEYALANVAAEGGVVKDEVALLREQTRQRRDDLRHTADMSDVELLRWIDEQMDESRLFTAEGLTLKKMAQALGLTQKRLGGLFKNHPRYSSLGDYINEKRFVEACRHCGLPVPSTAGRNACVISAAESQRSLVFV